MRFYVVGINVRLSRCYIGLCDMKVVVQLGTRMLNRGNLMVLLIVWRENVVDGNELV